jgi:hypothetical protein
VRRIQYRRDAAKRALITPDDAEAKARAAQQNTRAAFEEESAKKTGEDGVERSVLKDVSGFIPTRESEETAGIITLMTEDEFTALDNSAASQALAVQILPNGQTRSVRVRLPATEANAADGRAAYTATIEGVSWGSLREPKVIGSTKFLIDKRKATALRKEASDRLSLIKAADRKRMQSDPGAKSAKPGPTKPKGVLSEQAQKDAAKGKKNRQGKLTESTPAKQLQNLYRDFGDVSSAILVLNDQIEKFTITEEIGGQEVVRDRPDLTEDEEIVLKGLQQSRVDLREQQRETQEKITAINTKTGADTTKAGQVEVAASEKGKEAEAEEFVPKSEFDLRFPELYRKFREADAEAATKARAEKVQNLATRLYDTLMAGTKFSEKDVLAGSEPTAESRDRALGTYNTTELQQLFDKKELRNIAEVLGVRKTGTKAQIANAINKKSREKLAEHREEMRLADAPEPAPEPSVEEKLDHVLAARAAAVARRSKEAVVPPVEKFVKTSEGRSILNIGYLKQIVDDLRADGHSNTMINTILRDVYSELKNPEANRAMAFVHSKVMEQAEDTAPDQPLTINDSIGVMDKLAEAKDTTTAFGVAVENWRENAKGLKAEDITEAVEYFPGVTEFAREPDFLARPDETPEALRTEIERLQGLDLPEEGKAGTLTLDQELAAQRKPKQTVKVTKGKAQLGADNKLVGISDMEAAKERMRKAGLNVRAGVDPKQFADMLVVATFYVEAGARKFADFSKKMVHDFGDMVEPHLKKLWNEVATTGNFPNMELVDEVEQAAIPVTEEPATTNVVDVADAAKITEEEKAVSTPANEAELESKLKGEVPPKEKVFRQQNIRSEKLAEPKYKEEFEKPTKKGASSGLNRLWRTMTSSTSTLPIGMRPAARMIRKARSMTNAATVFMQLFQGEYLHTLEKNGIALNSKEHANMNRAVTAHIEGMRDASIQKEFGVVIPQELKDRLVRYVAFKAQLSEIAAMIDAVPKHIKTAIGKSKEHWLHKSFQQDPFLKSLLSGTGGKTAMEAIEKADPRLVKQLLQSGNAAFSLPTEPAGYRHIPKNHLKRMIGGANALIKAQADGTDYLLHEAPVLDKNGKVRLDKKGNPKTERVKLSEASHEQLVEYIHANPVNSEQIENFIGRMVNAIFTPAASGSAKATADVGDGSITRKRSMLLTQGQQIDKLINGLLATKVLPDDLRTALVQKRKEFKSLSRREFVETVAEKYPESAGRILERTGAEFDMYDTIRAGLKEITDPGELMQDSTTRLASAIELSKAITGIVELGIQSGRLVYGATEADVKNYTHGLGIQGEITTRGKAVPIAGLGEIMYQGPDGVASVLDDKGRPTIYGDKETIDALHQLLNAHASTQANLYQSNLYRLSALAKYDKVVLNPMAHPRNAMGSLMIGVGRGVIGGTLLTNPLVAAFTKHGSFMMGSALAISDLRAAMGRGSAVKSARTILARPQLESLARELAERGIFHDSVRQGAMADLFAHYQTLSAEDFYTTLSDQTSMARTNSGGVDFVSNSLSAAASRVGKIAGEAFRLEDEAIKGVAFLQRTRQFMSILSDESLWSARQHSGELINDYLDPAKRDSMTTEEVELVEDSMSLATDNVLATFPTFSHAPDGIKALSRNPFFGAFPTFQAEMIRNTINHYAFTAGLVMGYMPGGRKITDAGARRRAMALGTGLLSQQILWNATATAGLTALNAIARTHGKDTDDQEEAQTEGVRATIAEAVGNNLDSYNVYPFRNVLPSYHHSAAMGVIPGTINAEDGTFGWVNFGWSVPEGAHVETAYGFTNDLVRILGNDTLTDSFKAKAAKQIIYALGHRISGVFGNEEVFMRSLLDNFEERDGASVENLTNPMSILERGLNQWLRAAFSGAGDPTTEDLGITDSRHFSKGVAALITAGATNVPGTTALTQLIKAGMGAKEMIGDEQGFGIDTASKIAGSAVGLRYETFDYREDYAKTLSYTQLPQIKGSTLAITSTLFDPKEEYTEKEFKDMYTLLNKYRQTDFEAISAGLNFGSDRMGVYTNELREMWKTANRGRENAKVGGMEFRDYMNGTYRQVDTLSGTFDNIESKWREEGRVDDYRQRVRWLRDVRGELR